MLMGRVERCDVLLVVVVVRTTNDDDAVGSGTMWSYVISLW